MKWKLLNQSNMLQITACNRDLILYYNLPGAVKEFGGMEDIRLFCNFNLTPDIAEGKLKAPGEIVVMELLFKVISTQCEEGKLKAHEGIVVI